MISCGETFLFWRGELVRIELSPAGLRPRPHRRHRQTHGALRTPGGPKKGLIGNSPPKKGNKEIVY